MARRTNGLSPATIMERAMRFIAETTRAPRGFRAQGQVQRFPQVRALLPCST